MRASWSSVRVSMRSVGLPLRSCERLNESDVTVFAAMRSERSSSLVVLALCRTHSEYIRASSLMFRTVSRSFSTICQMISELSRTFGKSFFRIHRAVSRLTQVFSSISRSVMSGSLTFAMMTLALSSFLVREPLMDSGITCRFRRPARILPERFRERVRNG